MNNEEFIYVYGIEIETPRGNRDLLFHPAHRRPMVWLEKIEAIKHAADIVWEEGIAYARILKFEETLRQVDQTEEEMAVLHAR